MKSIKILAFLLLVFASVFASGFVSAQPEIAVMDVYLNSHYVGSNDVFSIERDSVLSVKVLFQTSDVSESGEVRVKAWIDGYRKSIEAQTGRFDIFAGRLYSKTLNLDLPADMSEGLYTLHVLITGAQSLFGDASKEVTIAVQRSNYKTEILSVDLALPAVVDAGKTLNANAVIKNRGSHKLEDIYVRATIPELGLSKVIYIGDLYPYDYADNTERDTKVVSFSFVIPSNVKSKSYVLSVVASNPDISFEKSATFEVKGTEVESEEVSVTQELTISTPNERKQIEAGKTATYEVILINLATKPLTIELNVVGTENWAKAELSKSFLTLPAKSSEAVTFSLNVNEDALTGSHIFSLQAKSNGVIIASKNFVAEIEGREFEQTSNLGFWIAIAILAAVALGLLITLIVLLIKQSEASEVKTEEIYY
ncbi:MAG: hypothetical protein QW622_02085 [Candidatus Pacearchaeota archaeon]